MDNDGSPYDMDSDDVLSQLTPEELHQFLSLGTAPDRQKMLQQQLLQAQALRSAPQAEHSTPMGALLGGIAGAGNELIGGMREQQLNGQMGDLLGGQVDARQAFLQKLLAQRQQPPSPMGAGDMMPGTTFGLG